MTTRRGFLGAMLAAAVAPALAGFQPTSVMSAIYPARYVSVDWFGADPLGVHDSTEAFQSAINEAMSIGAGVFIPRGTYRAG